MMAVSDEAADAEVSAVISSLTKERTNMGPVTLFTTTSPLFPTGPVLSNRNNRSTSLRATQV
jgi:hypothetical protein